MSSSDAPLTTINESEPIPDQIPTPLVCHICGATTSRRGKLFLNRGDLSRHLRSSHRDEPFSANGSAPAGTPHLDGHSRVKQSLPGRKLEPNHQTQAKFCPCCGYNLAVINAAMAFAAEHHDPL